MTYRQAVPSVNNSQSVALTTTSAQTTVLTEDDVIVIVTALAFVARGPNPTAVIGTSMALAPNTPYRLCGLAQGDKLAFIAATGTATAYLTPGV